ncbi:MAG: hypothetical protein QNJ22_09170 [Desulfosarcinaceae bacterium]|nr:hypothetical protein [Desulfosarcinaceae bacterium]
MRDCTQVQLILRSDKGDLSSFSPLLQKGFSIKARTGTSLKALFCEQLGVDAVYFEDRIQTIFLDGKPVDDPDSAIVRDGCTIALSAAMPGLVGSTFRRGGALADFRNTITYKGQAERLGMEGEGRVRVKLFNLLVGELGPVFLHEGIWVEKQDAARVLKALLELPHASMASFEKDGRTVSHDQLAALDWSEEPGDVHLSVLI